MLIEWKKRRIESNVENSVILTAHLVCLYSGFHLDQPISFVKRPN